MKNILKNNFENIGILGGTFDPPHVGHVHISKIAIKKLKLNKLMWIVTKQNPLKNKPHFNVKDRIKLSKKITNNQKKISVKYLDDIVKSKNTYDLLNYLNSKNKKINFFLLIGADNLIKFHKWKNWKKIPKLAKIVVFARGNLLKKIFNCIVSKNFSKKDWIYINSKKINISSSLIRKI